MNISNLVTDQLNEHKGQALLIGSANYPFSKVLAMRKYPFDLNAAEYTIENRIFPGCETLNQIESIGISNSIDFLHLNDEYQSLLCPYSGTQANQIVYNAILKKGDSILVFGEASGGHASHITFLNKFYNVIEYNFQFEQGINYFEIEKLIDKHKPKLVIAGSTLYPNSIDYALLSSFCKQHNALLLADISHTALYISTNSHTRVANYADFITYTTHKTTRGIRSAILNYKRKFKKQILTSLCSVSQGAPKYSDILCNSVMFEELKNTDLINYQKQIFLCSKLFIEMSKEYKIKTIGNGNSHLILVDLSESSADTKLITAQLEKNNILITNHSNENIKLLRFGVLTLATLELSNYDLIQLYEIIFKIISRGTNCLLSYENDVKNIMLKYTTKFYEENYGL